MIDEIHVENLALIEKADIAFAPGMTAITGETGAGKTALLSSCRLIMGGRADKAMVRQDCQEANVEARLFVPVQDVSDAEQDETDPEPDVIDPEQETVVSRTVSVDGRSRARIDGRMASVSELSERIGSTIDLCSQHDQQLLSSPSMQRRLLDNWSGVAKDGTLAAYQGALSEAKAAHAALKDVMDASQASDAMLQDAKLVLRQIDAVAPTQEDYDQITSALRKAESAELLARTSNEAHSALSDEGGVLDGLNAAIVLIEEGARKDEGLSQMADALRDATYIVEDAARDIGAYADAIDIDVGTLEFMQERAAAYQSLLRTYGPEISDVVDARNQAKAVVDAVENSDSAIEEAKRKVDESEHILAKAADDLSNARADSAPKFADAANAVMARLQMQGARIEFQMKRLPRESWMEEGPDEVRLMFVPGEGMQPRLLSRIASGGELSRVMLGIRVAMGERDSVGTLVFDEIDAGIGGETARALGELLSDLSKTHQVVVVTHLAQVAAFADKHYVAVKENALFGPVTTFEPLDGEDRRREVARMLSGTITESSLEHAGELLA